MVTRRAVTALFIAAISVSGCQSMRPLPISEPTDYSSATTPIGGLPPASSWPEGVQTVRAYGNTYIEAADKLHRSNYRASDAAFGGGLLGMIGGLTRSPETAVAGALLTGGGNTASERYQYMVQAKNYEKASEAMGCLERSMLLVTQCNSLDLFELNDAVAQIRRKLRNYQASVTLSMPDLTKLEAAVRASGFLETTAGQDRLNARKGNNQKQIVHPLFKAKIDQCLATF